MTEREAERLIEVFKRVVEEKLQEFSLRPSDVLPTAFEDKYMKDYTHGMYIDHILFRKLLRNASGGGGSIEHNDTLNKNINPDFLHITETEKTNFDNASDFVEDFISNATNILYADLLVLINNNELIPSSSYRITDYTTTTVQADTQSAGHDFDVIVTALSTNELSENAKCVRNSGDTYFENAKLEAWEIKYCINNDTNRFAWADSVNGKGVIYYMKDEWGNECPYDFKNIQFKKSGVFLYTFGGTADNSLTGGCHHNIMLDYVLSSVLTLNFNTFGNNCDSNTFGNNCHSNTFGDDCWSNTFGNWCSSNTFGEECYSNTFGDNCHSNTFSSICRYNTFGNNCYSNTFDVLCSSNIFDIVCSYNTFGNDCRSNIFGINCSYNTFDEDCGSNTFGDSCRSNTFGSICHYNTFGINCSSNNFYDGSIGTTKKDYLRYIVLEDGVSNNNFYSDVPTSCEFLLQRIRIKGLVNATPTDTQITLSSTNTDYNWVVAKDSSGVVQQYCIENLVDAAGISDAPSNGFLYGRQDGDWEQIDAYTKTESDGKYETIENVDLLEGIVSGHTTNISNLQSGKADKATTLSGYGITDAYTKTEVDNKISAVFRYKGSVTTYDDLNALTGMTVGDVYNVTETGDNYAWTGTEWDKLSGEIDLSAYLTIVDASNTYETKVNVNSLSNIVSGNTEDIGYLKSDKANASDLLSVSGRVSDNTEDISDLQSGKADKATTLSGYGITDTPSDNKTYGRKNGDWKEIDGFSIISITYTALKKLRDNIQLVPGQSYRITDYITTTTQTDTQSAGNVFDIIVTALDENTLSENASAIQNDWSTYFTNAKVESWELKYCIDNDTNRFAWADNANGKGVIYYMKDAWGNECPYDFKNIKYLKNSAWVYTFGGTTDNSLVATCSNNKINPYILSNKQTLNNITFGMNCHSNTFGVNCYQNTFGENCDSNTFGSGCYSNTFGDSCYSNTLGNSFYSNTFSKNSYSNTFGDRCVSNTFGEYFYSNTFGNEYSYNTIGSYCNYNTFGDRCELNTFGIGCDSNTFGAECSSNTLGDGCYSNTFGDGCQSNNFYHGTIGSTTPKNYIKYIVLENGVSYNNFYSDLTTSSSSYLQRIRIKGLENNTPTDTQINTTANNKFEWVVCYTSGGTLKQYCPND